MRITQEKIRGVHQSVIFFFRCHGEPRQHRCGKGIAHRAFFGGVFADSAIVQIFLDEQNFGTAALETDNAGGAELSAVEPDIIGADSRGQAALVEKFGVPLINFEPEFALFGVPVKIEIAGELLGSGGLFTDGGGGRVGERESAGAQPQQREQEDRDARILQHFQSLRRCQTFYIISWCA